MSRNILVQLLSVSNPRASLKLNSWLDGLLSHSGTEVIVKSVKQPLNLVFLCGSLEPGRDGVGDYTRRLAAHLIRQGGRASIIAINDHHVASCQGKNSYVNPEVQKCDDLSVPVLRLASSLPWKRRIDHIQGALDIQNPQWVSLQYVPHAYSTKGIPFRLPYHLKMLKCNSRWHVMFHEIWGAKQSQSPVIRNIIIWLQRRIVAQLNRALPIAVAHTSINLWRQLLDGVNIQASILPLISNIPVDIQNHSARQMLLAGLEISEPDSRALILTLFGTIRFDWALMGLVDRVQELLSRSPWTHAVFISVGRAGDLGETIWRGMEAKASSNCHFLRLGALPPEQISQILHMSNAGVAMYYPEHLGKSGCVAAMADHGLPVIIPDRGGGTSDSNLGVFAIRTIPFDHNFETALLSCTRNEPSDSVHQIAMALAHSLCGFS